MDETLVERVRLAIGEDPNIAEIKMFGGMCFTLNGNMLVGVTKAGALMVRVSEDQLAQALKQPGAAQMKMGPERVMKGFLSVDPDALSDQSLRQWVAAATNYVGPMPPKEPKPKKPAKAK